MEQTIEIVMMKMYKKCDVNFYFKIKKKNIQLYAKHVSPINYVKI